MMLWRSITTFGFAVCFMLANIANISAAEPAHQQQAEPKRVNCDCLNVDSPAKSAADAWLSLIDQGDYQQSYIAASRVVHHYHNLCSWLKHMWKVRHCRGKLEARDLVSCQMCRNPKGMPCGQYFYLQYHTCFECGDPVCESVILHCERDCACGVRWKVAHYSIQ